MQTDFGPRRPAAELAEIEGLAWRLLAQHGLKSWSFRFDRARVRAGSCRYRQRLITLSRLFAEVAPAAEIVDTLLHEIAHALVGHRAGHGPLWRAKAQEIGCTAARCHNTAFAAPRFHAVCERGCFEIGVHRRRRRVICRRCGGAVRYREARQAGVG